jgi:hypothetical protein
MSALQNILVVLDIEIEEAKISQETSLRTKTIGAQQKESVSIINAKSEMVALDLQS